MKNIYVIPTNEPSRVYGIIGSYRLGLTSNDPFYTENFGGGTQNQNIYVTSDEEVEDGEYGICLNLIREGFKSHQAVFKMNSGQRYAMEELGGQKKAEVLKVIITTDQDLIKGGVQPIEDEFLEWFVKNPSCEKVEITYETPKVENAFQQGILNGLAKNYPDVVKKPKIIIPKEEPMSYEEFRESASNDLIRKFDTDCSKYSEDGHSDNYFYANCKYWENKLKEEPKQENKVLVEMQQILRRDSKFMGHYESCDLCHYNAFFKYLYNGEILYRCQGHKIVDINNLKSKFGFGSNEPKQETLEEAAFNFTAGKPVKEVYSRMDFVKGAMFGAKWQADRMYSEEEVMEMFHNLSMHLPLHYEFLVKEQFKKK